MISIPRGSHGIEMRHNFSAVGSDLYAGYNISTVENNLFACYTHINNTQNNLTQNKNKKDNQEQFIIQPKTKHKTDLIFMKSQNKQRQRSELRIPVWDKHFEVE